MRSVYVIWLSGELDRYIELGIVRYSVVSYCKIHHEYLKFRAMGLNYTKAVIETANLMATSEQTVKRAIAEVI